MKPKNKKYLSLAGFVGALLLLDAMYLNHVDAACDPSAGVLETYILYIFLVIFTGLILLAPLGTASKHKWRFVLLKAVIIIGFIVILFAISASFCF